MQQGILPLEKVLQDLDALLPVYTITVGKGRVWRNRNGWRVQCLRKGLDDDRIDFGIAVESTTSNAVCKNMAGSRRDDADGEVWKRQEMPGQSRDACGVSIAYAGSVVSSDQQPTTDRRTDRGQNSSIQASSAQGSG